MQENMIGVLRELRQRLQMTQEEFAHELGITVGTVNRWENRRFRPSKLAKAKVTELARRYGVPVPDSRPDIVAAAHAPVEAVGE